MSTNHGHRPGHNTISLAFLAIAVLAALLLAGPRDWTDNVRILYAAIGAVIALGAVGVLAIRAGKKVGDEQTEKHFAWIAGLCILGLGVAVVALALPPPGDDSAEPEHEETADAGAAESGDAGSNQGEEELLETAESAKPSRPGPGIDESIARAGVALSRGEIRAAEDGFRHAAGLAEKEGNADRLITARLGLTESLIATRKLDEALELIEKTKAWAEGAFEIPPADSIRLLVVEGSARTRMRDAETGIPVIEQAIVLTDEHYPADLELRGSAGGALLDAQMAVDQPDRALAAVNTHLQKVRADPGTSKAEIGSWIDSVGRVLGAMGRYDDSISRLEDAIELIDDGGKGDPVQVALVRSDLALSQFVSGKKALAKKTLARAREVLDQNLPEDHPARVRAAAMAADFEKDTP
jgi:tetratricopeptide (TPR) repeat protein